MRQAPQVLRTEDKVEEGILLELHQEHLTAQGHITSVRTSIQKLSVLKATRSEKLYWRYFINQAIKDPYGTRQYMTMLQGSACAIKTEAAAEINVCTEATKAGKTILMTFQIRKKPSQNI